MEIEECNSKIPNSLRLTSDQYSSNSQDKDYSEKSTCLQPSKLITKTVVKRSKKTPIFLQKQAKKFKKEALLKINFNIQPLFYQPNQQIDVYANGDVILEYDFHNNSETNKKTLGWSYLKQVAKVETKNNMNTIEIHYSVNVEQRKDLDSMIEKYINTPNQKTHELGMVLREFQIQKTEVLNNFFILVQNNPNIVDPLFQLQKEYVAACLDWIQKNISQNNFNKQFQQYEQNLIGFSKPLIELLGMDSRTFENYIFRKGRFEIYNSISRMEMIIQKIQYGIQKWSEKKWDVVLLTVEDIPVYCQQRKLALSVQQFQDIVLEYKLQNIINENWIDYINLCGITEFYINDNQIQNVLNKRKQIEKYDPISYMNDDELRYQAQRQFLWKVLDIKQNLLLK